MFPRKDLKDIPFAKNYRCPFCKSEPPEDDYMVEGERYPQYYNDNWYGASCHNWEELHKCSNCGNKYVLINGDY